MDGAKIFIARPGDPNVNQMSYFIGHKGRHGVIYLTVTTSDVLKVYLSRKDVRPRHNMIQYRQSGVYDA